MRQVMAIIKGPFDLRFALGGARRKTHRFPSASIVALAFDPNDALSLQHLSCELCRRAYALTATYRADHGYMCPRPDCLQRAFRLRGHLVTVRPIGRIL